MRSITTSILVFLFLTLCIMAADAQSVGGTVSGASTYCTTTNSGFLSLTGYTGTILNWESSTNGGVTWTNTGNTTSAQSYFALTQTTCYRTIVQSGAFPPDTSTTACITIYQPSDGGTITGGGTFCSVSGTGSLNVSGETGSVVNWLSSTDGGVTWSNISNTTTSQAYSGITLNTLYAAVVQNATCPQDTSALDSIRIVPASAGGAVTADDTVCYLSNAGSLNLSGNIGTITGWLASIDGGTNWVPLANTASSQPYGSLAQTTTFAAIVQNASCPADTSTFATITVLALPTVSAGNDTTIAPGQSVTLQGNGNGNPVWTPSTSLSSSSIFTPVASPSVSTGYTLIVTDTNGCTNSDAVYITVIPPVFNGLIASLFTPNGDGINDTWFIQNIQSYPGNEVMIFNIHGQMVFDQKNYMNDWKGTFNGSDLPDGTYYYVLKFTGDERTFKGSLDILRNK